MRARGSDELELGWTRELTHTHGILQLEGSQDGLGLSICQHMQRPARMAYHAMQGCVTRLHKRDLGILGELEELPCYAVPHIGEHKSLGW